MPQRQGKAGKGRKGCYSPARLHNALAKLAPHLKVRLLATLAACQLPGLALDMYRRCVTATQPWHSRQAWGNLSALVRMREPVRQLRPDG